MYTEVISRKPAGDCDRYASDLIDDDDVYRSDQQETSGPPADRAIVSVMPDLTDDDDVYRRDHL